MKRESLPGPDRRDAECGIALILGLLFTIVAVGLTFTGSMILSSHRAKTETSFALHGQADQFARAGLTDAVGWLKKQTSQPVTTFAPVLDPLANPPILETDDPDIGVVREFPISGAVWGRYEVWKPWPGDPDPQRLAWRQQMQANDVSMARSAASMGTVWRLRSIGYVFRRADPAKRFDEAPNQVLGQEILEVEARRMSITPPAPSALSGPNGANIAINSRGKIMGGSTGSGIYYLQGTGTPSTGPISEERVTGTPALAPSPSYNGSVEDVFSVPIDQLRAMASTVITDINDFPVPIPDASVVVVDLPSATLDNTRPLSGFGVVVFTGDLTILPGSNSSFSGMVYVDGNFVLREPSEIRGAVVATGNVVVQGASDFATIMYDEDSLNALRQLIGNYRISSPIARPLGADRPR